MNKFLAAVELAIEDGTFDYIYSFPGSKRARQLQREVSITLLKNYLVDWFAIKKPNLKASTIKSYKNIINNFLIPFVGELSLSDLKRYHVKRMVIDWDVTRKLSNNRLSVLRTALADAVDDELIENNILFGWTYHHKKETPSKDEEIFPLNRDEIKTFLGSLTGGDKNIFQTLLFTGMRPSEARCLTWQDIDMNNMTIRVNKSQTDSAKEPEIPKTPSSIRTIKMLAPVKEALKDQMQFTYMQKGLVFVNPRTGEQWNRGRLYKIWTKKLAENDINHRRMYQTRHTYASMMLSAGEPLMWVANQMGHANWLLLGDIYAKWIPSTNPDAGSKAIDIFWSK